MSTKTGSQLRAVRHSRVRRKISGTTARPRLAAFRSNKFIYAQLIDDESGRTLAATSSRAGGDGNKTDAARRVGEQLAAEAIKLGIETAVFDRGGFRYHGRIAAVAEGARSGGLKF